MKNFPIIKAGDAGLSSSNGVISKIIRFGGALHTGVADRSHAFAGVENNQIIEALVRVRINDFDKYADQDIEIWEPPLSEGERKSFHIGMLKAAGDSYGWGKPVLAGFDSILTGFKKLFTLNKKKDPIFFFSKRLGFLSFKNCSQLLFWGWEKYAGFQIRDTNHKPVDWRVVTPDYAQDLFHLPHNRMKLVFKQLAGGKVIVDLDRLNGGN